MLWRSLHASPPCIFPFCFPHGPRYALIPIKSQFAVAVLWSKLQLPTTYHWLPDHFRSLCPSGFPCCSCMFLASLLPIIHSWLWQALLSSLVSIVPSLFLSLCCSPNCGDSLLMWFLVHPSVLGHPALAFFCLAVGVSVFHSGQT